MFLPTMHNSDSCIYKTIKYKSKYHTHILESLVLDCNKHKELIPSRQWERWLFNICWCYQVIIENGSNWTPTMYITTKLIQDDLKIKMKDKSITKII